MTEDYLLEFALPMLYPGPREPLQERMDYNERMLLRALDGGKTVAILGSGISQAFGYPSWARLALDLLDATKAALEKKKGPPPELEDIKLFQAGAQNASLDANALMFLIGACRSALKENGIEDCYKKFIDQHFASAPRQPDCDPFAALLRLPIQRFTTTNYDQEIERALVKYRSACPRKLGIERGPKMAALLGTGSFTQLNGPERLVRFALAEVDEQEEEVFHCHGRYDELKSIVATEGDYQHWYLDSRAGGPLAFQELIELLLGSNPLLFIGYSLGDEDLLRPLRQLGLLDPAQKTSRPFFALFPCAEGEAQAGDHYKHAAFLERFGLHVLSYPRSNPQNLTLDLCNKLQEIYDSLQQEHGKRNQKPKLRPTCSPERPPKPHCEIQSAEVPSKPWLELETAITEPGVLLVIGPSGCGKSHHLLDLVHKGEAYGFAGSFYWNAHYANEAVTALDTVLSYLDPDGRHQGTRYDRLRECLRERRCLLVIDGCERLLRRNDAAGEGTSYSATFHRLLAVVTDPQIQSTVVIAGQLRPVDLKDSPLRPVRILRASRIEARDLLEQKLFSGFDEEDAAALSALCSLLRGHAYGLQLAGEYLKLCRLPREGLRELIRQLSDEMRDERLHAMVRILLQALDSPALLDFQLPRKPGSGLTRAFLERLALFLSPVCKATLELCYKQARQAGCDDTRPFPDLDCLRETGLLIPVGPPAAKTDTVHVTVRAALFPGRRGPVEDSLPAFGLSGFTSGRLGVNPEPDYGPQVKELFDAILDEAKAKEKKQDVSAACGLCRDAYNLIRTRMEANTAPRWCTYQEYLRYGLGVAALAKRITPGKWTYCEHPDLASFAEDAGAPLYLAELAWLYNDIALALSAGGHVTDACFFWEQTYEISRLIEDPLHGGGYHLEVLLSLAYTSIERGRLAAAAQYLDDAERFLRDWPDEDYHARVLGLRGLMAHLQGNLQKATDLYERCLGLLRTGNNLRAQSVFSKHLADIKIATQQFGEADMLIRNSRALAEAGVFPELAVNVRISQGHLLSRTGQSVQARLEYDAVLSEARRVGFRKLEVRALTALARLALQQKDVDGARRHAMQALSLANELGLGLRQSHGLVVLGLATLEAGQKELGIAYLRLAKRMADGQQYWARSREAENKLRELGEPLQETGDGNPRMTAGSWAGV